MTNLYRYPGRRVILLCALVIGACGGSGGGQPAFLGSAQVAPPPGDLPAAQVDLQIKTLANRADLISDGDALVEIVLPEGASASDLKVDVNGADVSKSFAARPNGRVLGVLSALPEGVSVVSARMSKTGRGAKLQITNHGRGNSIFSGPQVQPWICATPTPKQVTAVALGTGLSGTVTTHASGLDAEPSDNSCNTAIKYTYYYQPAGTSTASCTTIVGGNPCYLKYDPTSRPNDAKIADFTNDRGITVKALLRLEEGVVDRGGYQVLTYFDPKQSWQPWEPQPGWNGKLLWRFGGGSGGSQFQGTSGLGIFSTQSSFGTDGIFQPDALKHGYMIAAAQFTNNSENVNHVLAAEQMMMLKEHIVDTYGEVRFTVGDGVSGGSIQQNLISSVMPGLLQGHIVGLSFPDEFTPFIDVRDCSAIGRYITTPAGATLSPAQRLAIQGGSSACSTLGPALDSALDPRNGANCGGLADPVGLSVVAYDPVSRPLGVRCSLVDQMAPVLGKIVDQDRNLKTKLPYDNTGVQYGLRALTSGQITAEQFVQLNEGIGALDMDMNWTTGTALTPVIPAPRFRMLPDVPPIMYQSGLVSNARNLAKVAIIDIRTKTAPDIHEPWRTMQQRARLDAGNGTHANFVTRAMGMTASPYNFVGPALLSQSFDMMDRWLSAVESDLSSVAIENKILRNRPVDVHDGCYNSAGVIPADLATEVSLTDSSCPVSADFLLSSPRQAAGSPQVEDIFKCQFKPFDAAGADYAGVAFTAGQISRMKAVFPDGVCDWAKPGIGQGDAASGMLDFTGGPGGKSLPAAPVSESL